MNSWEPISWLVSPSLASLAIWVSWLVSSETAPAVRLRTLSPVAMSSRRARSAKPSAPMRLKAS